MNHTDVAGRFTSMLTSPNPFSLAPPSYCMSCAPRHVIGALTIASPHTV